MMNHGATSNAIAKISAETMVGAEPSPNRMIAKLRRVDDPNGMVEDPADRLLTVHLRGGGDRPMDEDAARHPRDPAPDQPPFRRKTDDDVE